MAVEIAKATEGHVRELVEVLRVQDAETCLGIGHGDALAGILSSLTRSEDAVALLAEGCVFCVAGVAPLQDAPGLAQLWCATSVCAKRHSLSLCRIGREMVRRWLDGRTALLALVDDRDDGARRWVEWLGLRFVPVGWQGPAGRFRIAIQGRC